jgi:glutathione S-transferase
MCTVNFLDCRISEPGGAALKLHGYFRSSAKPTAKALQPAKRCSPASPARSGFGGAPTLADLCLVPQLANARRIGVQLEDFPRLLAAEAAARSLKAFADAAPERQIDAE